MLANRLLTVAALLLAGCVSEAEVPDNGMSEVAAAPGLLVSPAPSPVPPAPRPARQDAIPAAFHGVYDGSLEACGRPSDGRLTVSAGELRFHESIGAVRSVESAPSGTIRVEADYQGEGESWRSSRDLHLSGDGAALTISGDGTGMARVRCPAGAR